MLVANDVLSIGLDDARPDLATRLTRLMLTCACSKEYPHSFVLVVGDVLHLGLDDKCPVLATKLTCLTLTCACSVKNIITHLYL